MKSTDCSHTRPELPNVSQNDATTNHDPWVGRGCSGGHRDSKCETPTLYDLPMSSWEDHEQMIDDQYLMESIEEDQKLEEGDLDEEEDFEEEEI